MIALNRQNRYVLILLFLSFQLTAQERTGTLPRTGLPGNIRGNTGAQIPGLMGGGRSMDSLERRDKYEDSITIYFQFPESALTYKLDSSIIDFTERFPIPAHHVYLGNNGTATRSILFEPAMQAGWDHGFHAFDVYRWKPENVRFFNTTRPYTELAYLLGGRTEQVIEVTHTQNIKPNWNGLFQYRLINAPGFFKNQRTNHNNYLLTSWYQSVNKRYNNYFTIVANSLQSEENGGIRDDKDYLKDPIYDDRFEIPVKLGGDPSFTRNFFGNTMNTGNRHNDFNFILKQQYDIGKKDSLVRDSVVIPLFYPRLRFQHTFQYSSYKFLYMDNLADSVFYKTHYGFSIPSAFDTVHIQDSWKEVMNEFSIYQFPDAKNQLQFIRAGARFQYLRGNFQSGSNSFFNTSAFVEYRNKTRNKKWDMALMGTLFASGLNAGNYEAAINLKRFSGKRDAFVEVGFRNSNKTPAFVFDSRSSFYLDAAKQFKNENLTHLFASIYNPALKLLLTGNYFLVGNYTYFKKYFEADQEETLFNVLQVSAARKFRLGKNCSWYADVYVQQKTGDAPLNLPLIFTRNRLGYEGNLGFRKLNIFMGFELKYHTPYKADHYSPVLGRFYFQDVKTISNRPDIAGFVHFRIRNFRAFFRAENLNSMTFQNGFAFRNNNLAANGYAYPGLNMRLGIYWNFVN